MSITIEEPYESHAALQRFEIDIGRVEQEIAPTKQEVVGGEDLASATG
jgi:hypothetical protein